MPQPTAQIRQAVAIRTGPIEAEPGPAHNWNDGPMDFARELWRRVETIHAVTYFDPIATEATTAAGLTGFWMGYFGARAAPMGPVAAGVVEATFFNFAPGFVRRWVPERVGARRRRPPSSPPGRAAAARSLRAITPVVEALAEAVAGDLAAAVGRGAPAGRPLFAANRDVPLPDDPVAGAVAALHQPPRAPRRRARGGTDGGRPRRPRGPRADLPRRRHRRPRTSRRRGVGRRPTGTPPSTAGAARGLVDGGGLTDAGRAVRAEVEAATDRLAEAPFAAVAAADRAALLAALDPVAVAVSRSGIIRYPNPIGLPPL